MYNFTNYFLLLNSELGNKPVKHRECSKLIIHNVEWLKKNPVKFNGFQRYSSALVGKCSKINKHFQELFTNIPESGKILFIE